MNKGQHHMAIDYINNPYDRGRENFCADFEITDNPYPKNTQAHEDWSRGFLDQLNIEIST
ncbi:MULTISPECIES: hypothetical protein [unclassified Pseudoalteromonas]|uniref:hypothetical protein n=2 Tax=Pseudoalteromonas TaxID=53246 RepID=UPI001300C05D|nr:MULTISPECIES: hypothetical protein [unclassified Pseudoalteromonas]